MSTVRLFGDRNYILARQIATENENVRLLKICSAHELLETHRRSMYVRCKEWLEENAVLANSCIF